MQKRQSILCLFRGYLPVLLHFSINSALNWSTICCLTDLTGFFHCVRYIHFFRCCNDLCSLNYCLTCCLNSCLSSCCSSASEHCCSACYCCFSIFIPPRFYFASTDDLYVRKYAVLILDKISLKIIKFLVDKHIAKCYTPICSTRELNMHL